MVTGRQLQKMVSGLFTHYSDEEINNCSVGLEIKITINAIQCSRGSATSAFLISSLGTSICYCFKPQFVKHVALKNNLIDLFL